jgi:hypothetical protein
MSAALEAAATLVAAAQQPPCLPCWHAKPGIRCGCVQEAAAIITAVLAAAAEDAEAIKAVWDAFDNDGPKAAILALKEAVG